MQFFALLLPILVTLLAQWPATVHAAECDPLTYTSKNIGPTLDGMMWALRERMCGSANECGDNKNCHLSDEIPHIGSVQITRRNWNGDFGNCWVRAFPLSFPFSIPFSRLGMSAIYML